MDRPHLYPPIPQVHIYYILRGDTYNGPFINSGLGGRLNTSTIHNSNSLGFGPLNSSHDPHPSSGVPLDRDETSKPGADKPHANPSTWILHILRAFRLFLSTTKWAACHRQQYIIPISLLVGNAVDLIPPTRSPRRHHI
ncbi:hypothetical protein ONZ45_g9350 [Pleurotus djamor]|nr:hypothetical protein ONZ45_g9350 [Pleurotus djamor]